MVQGCPPGQRQPAPTIDLTWRVTPRLRVASTITGHAYDDGLYRPLQDQLVTSQARRPDSQGRVHLADVDVLHMAWPEWWSGIDPNHTRQVLDELGLDDDLVAGLIASGAVIDRALD